MQGRPGTPDTGVATSRNALTIDKSGANTSTIEGMRADSG
jgi:hypothetical protein